MRAITASKSIFEACLEQKKNGSQIGLVPTMGALHKGHLALVKRSLEENDVTVVSIFVNPIQFNKQADLKAYPRTPEKDLPELEKLDVDLVFTPEEVDLYPEKPSVSISFGTMEHVLEGAFRPDHFGGVGVIVSKLFHLTQPDRAYFGLKDLQQFLLIKRMAHELNFPIEVVGVATQREPSGLALSSRNQRLSKEGLDVAAHIYQGLQKMEAHLLKSGDPIEARSRAMDFYGSIEGLDVEYLEVVNAKNLDTLRQLIDVNELAICFAGYVEGVRLIDNLYLRLK